MLRFLKDPFLFTYSCVFSLIGIVSIMSVVAQSSDSLYGDLRNEQLIKEALLVVDQNPDSAIAIVDEVLPILRFGQKELKGFCFLVKGDAYYNKNRFVESKNAYLMSIDLYRQSSKKDKMAMLYNNLGLSYYSNAQYDSAMVVFLESLKLESANQNQEGIAKSYQNIGLVYYQIGNNAKFLDYMKKALLLYERLNDNIRFAEAANNMAIAYAADEDYDNAQLYYNKAYKAFDEYGDQVNVGNVLNNIGNLYFYKGQYKQAEENLRRALEIFQKMGNIQGMIHSHTRLGDVLSKNFKTSEAMMHYMVCEELNKGLDIKDLQLKNLQSLLEAYKEIEDFESALRISEQYYSLRDSIFSIDKLQTIVEVERKFELEKQRNELDAISQKRTLMVLAITGLGLLILFMGGFIFLWLRHLKIKERQRLMTLEYKVLRNQLNPHFLFNALSTIQYYVLENKMVEAIEYLGDFSQLIRMVLQYSQEEYVSLENEARILETYLNIQTRRFDNRFSYLLHIDESVDKSKVLIPPMLAQPFIENAIELGNLNSGAVGSLWISFSISNNQLKYRLQDNGVGMIPNGFDSQKGVDHHSMAVMLTRERLKLINQGEPRHPVLFETMDLVKYGKSGQLVEFSIPLHLLP
jgi:tetratricopeptide (TPR) repeat protein